MTSINREGLRVALADVNAERLAEAGAACAKLVGEANVLVVPTDVSKLEDVERLRDRVLEQWGEVSSQNLLALSLREGASCLLEFFGLLGLHLPFPSLPDSRPRSHYEERSSAGPPFLRLPTV